jgi:hydrogenase-4 component E
MKLWTETLIVLLILTNLKLISSSRLSACIRIVAVQGILLGVVPLLAGQNPLTWRIASLAGLTMILKGMVFPWLLLKAMRSANVRREMEPFVGYSASLIVAAGLLGFSIWMGRQLPMPFAVASPLITPMAVFTIMIGLFAVISRRKAVTQVLGYLVMENGIYAFGLSFAQQEPFLIELGTLLDVFMAVFVMGITIFHINREFNHIDADRLNALRG